MKILQLTTHFNIGGISNYILILSKTLKERGNEILVVSSGGNLTNALSDAGIEHSTIDIQTKSELSLKVFRSVFALMEIIKREKPDIIHAHTRVSQVVAFFACRMTGVPFVTTCHGYFKKRLRGIFDTWGSKVIAISSPVMEHLERDLGVSHARIALVHNGIDLSKFSKNYSPEEIVDMKKALGFPPITVIGTIGRLSPVKGQRYLIQAIAEIMKQKIICKCIIIGDGPEERRLKNLTISLNADEPMYFYHSTVDTDKYLAVMDIFVLPSLKEGLGMALLEALAAGKPCIASDVGGIRDIIEHGVTGFLVPAQDHVAMAQAIVSIIKDKDLAGQMGSRGRELVEKKFSCQKMADGVASVYGEVLGGRGI